MTKIERTLMLLLNLGTHNNLQLKYMCILETFIYRKANCILALLFYCFQKSSLHQLFGFYVFWCCSSCITTNDPMHDSVHTLTLYLSRKLIKNHVWRWLNWKDVGGQHRFGHVQPIVYSHIERSLNNFFVFLKLFKLF